MHVIHYAHFLLAAASYLMAISQDLFAKKKSINDESAMINSNEDKHEEVKGVRSVLSRW
jgi:hypothetical protein